MPTPAPAALKSAVHLAARKRPVAVAKAEAIRGRCTCVAKPTRLIFRVNCLWPRASSSVARTKAAPRPNANFSVGDAVSVPWFEREADSFPYRSEKKRTNEYSDSSE